MFRPAKSPGRQTLALLSSLSGKELPKDLPSALRPGAITFRRPSLSVLSLFLGGLLSLSVSARPWVLFAWLLLFPLKLPWDADGTRGNPPQAALWGVEQPPGARARRSGCDRPPNPCSLPGPRVTGGALGGLYVVSRNLDLAQGANTPAICYIASMYPGFSQNPSFMFKD